MKKKWWFWPLALAGTQTGIFWALWLFFTTFTAAENPWPLVFLTWPWYYLNEYIDIPYGFAGIFYPGKNDHIQWGIIAFLGEFVAISIIVGLARLLRRIRSALGVVIFGFTLILCLVPEVTAWDPQVKHSAFTDRAWRELGWTLGTPFTNERYSAHSIIHPNQWMLSRPINQLIIQGAIDEDDGQRGINHFFNPIDQSGLLDPISSSSREWASTKLGNPWRYEVAFDRYRDALQTTDPVSRRQHFGECYYRVGTCAHLVQDLTQPEHVRADQHYDQVAWIGSSIYVESGYVEVYAANRDFYMIMDRAADAGVNVTTPIQVQSLAEYWTSTGPQGIAGLVNRNFFSPNRIYPLGTADFPLPRYPDDINENPAALNSLTYTSYQLPGGGGPILGAYLTHRNQHLAAAPMKLARAGYYTFDVTPDPNAVPGTIPSYQIHAWNASWMLTHDVLDDYLTVQWPLAVRASAGVLHHFFPGWTIDATAALQGDTLKVSGTIKHNREPGTFRWNDVSSNRTCGFTILTESGARTETTFFSVSNGAFDTELNWPRLRNNLNLPADARPASLGLAFAIGAEAYARDIVPASITQETFTFRFGYHSRDQPLELSGAAFVDTDRVRLSRDRLIAVTGMFGGMETPRWSHDGRRVIHCDPNLGAVVSYDEATSQRTIIASSPFNGSYLGEGYLDVSSDDDRIVFQVDQPNQGMGILHFGGNLFPRPAGCRYEACPAWSPDNQKILIGYILEDDRPGLRIVAPDGGILSHLPVSGTIGTVFTDWCPETPALILHAMQGSDMRFLSLDGGMTPPPALLWAPVFMGRGEAVAGFDYHLVIQSLDGSKRLSVIPYGSTFVGASPVAAKLVYEKWVWPPSGEPYNELHSVGAANPEWNEGEILTPFFDLSRVESLRSISLTDTSGDVTGWFRTAEGDIWHLLNDLDTQSLVAGTLQIRIRLARVTGEQEASVGVIQFDCRGGAPVVTSPSLPPIAYDPVPTFLQSRTPNMPNDFRRADWTDQTDILSTRSGELQFRVIWNSRGETVPGIPRSFMRWLPWAGDNFRRVDTPTWERLPHQLVPTETECLMRHKDRVTGWHEVDVRHDSDAVRGRLLPGCFAIVARSSRRPFLIEPNARPSLPSTAENLFLRGARYGDRGER